MAVYSSLSPTAAVTLVPAAAQAPASNTAAVATLALHQDNQSWHLAGIRWSYSGDPTSGSLTITWIDSAGSGIISETYYINKGGPGFLPFNPPKRFPGGPQVTITLAAGGSGVSGSVYPDAWGE